jgi:oligopeptide/dipeptide ABC transporter ATP-binding protein
MAPVPSTAPPLVTLEEVSKRFVRPIDAAQRIANVFGGRYVNEVTHAVDSVSLEIRDGEVVGLVGESGCGKSTVGRMVVGLLQPSEGRILNHGRDVATMSAGERKSTSLNMQMIFQDPFSSLNPRMRVGEIIGQAPRLHRIVEPASVDAYVDEMLGRIGLDAGFRQRYPHQLSGGQRQRVCIARALAVKPSALVCDEAVAALDVSIQAQILNLFMELRETLALTYLFISHDLGVVEHLSDRIVVMYLGRIVEMAPTDELFSGPNHPYTQALLAEVPDIAVRRKRYVAITGEIPSPLNPPSGCHFHPRCAHAMPRCSAEKPVLTQVAPGHWSACHLNVMQ